jgi:exopolysaccharide biosynthesis polyprenyl glycosylphosphotransferase
VIQDIIRLCEIEGVEVWLLGSFFKTSVARARVDEFQDLPMLTFSTTPSASWALFTKRLLDLAGSFVLLALTSPIILAAALAIKWTSPGTIIFRQERCTLYGRTFTMYKFRTMVDEAEQLRTELEARNEQAGPVFKIREDPRITPVGRFIRRYSIDELPQLINVLKGDMSLVGPRPPIPSEVAKYESWQRRRLSMRSGITCIWQTMGRNEVTFEDWMKLDLEYIDRWSLLLDAQILLRTPAVVLRGTGF